MGTGGTVETCGSPSNMRERVIALEMSGHSTPGKAVAQMTKLQNATDKRTPV